MSDDGDVNIKDVMREPYPTPCVDCGRTYIQGENVTWTVSKLTGNGRVIWTGCIDCWILRTNPYANKALVEFANAIRLTVEYVGNDMLPALEGWTWFDVLDKYYPEMAQVFVDKPILFNKNRRSGLVDHAKRELDLLGEEPETVRGYLNVIQAFADMGHSGGSASVAIPVLHELLQYHNLMPLTDNPDEWIYHDKETWGERGGIWQNSRNSEAFSHDGGKTYYLLSEGGNEGDPNPIHVSEKRKA